MGESRRVALLARPGEACERLRSALQEAGGEIVLEADPAMIEPSALADARAQTILIALDPAVEDALEKFDEVLSDPSLAVIFDEAELAARREGWDAARWVRHLSAKLNRHADVLPPGREPESDALLVPGRPEAPEARHADADIATFAAEADAVAVDVPREPVIGEAALELPAFDADLGGEIVMEGVELDGLALDELSLDDLQSADMSMEAVSMESVSLDDIAFDDSVAQSSSDATPASEPAFGETALDEISFGDMTFAELPVHDTVQHAPTDAPAFGGIAFTDDVNALDFEAEEGLSDQPRPSFRHDAGEAHDFDAMMRDLGAHAANETESDVLEAVAPVRAAPAELPNLDFDIAPIEAPAAAASTARPAKLDFSSLSLADVTDEPHVATPMAIDEAAAPQFRQHLDALDEKIATLALVDEAAVSRGAVLILAGIGGPDAVRQILTALPTGFARPVLISQRLDGGRYDRLVQQMARAASLPVTLAEAATVLEPGHVYIVPPELGLESVNGLRFASNATLLAALPPADSAVLLLSGADPALVDPALAHAAKGALVAGQSPDGCYDAAAPMALTARGGEASTPHDLVNRLLLRWPA
ncbi:hypothetical protein LYSHEL_06190 [Lysobacter helvus]|uniref:CheB-type methylesterase domain-containing protein n=2 Tax=Lysobacteraceae TaxID=32033 RepID=A0ABM7Q2X5_9GAMM|nr:hypothetical protein LYSCAS_06190 [Lysobacter caseinilyticus]BCT94748.1 hypothetical protein LYSHEL_06190 [Lysobacter helvus]